MSDGVEFCREVVRELRYIIEEIENGELESPFMIKLRLRELRNGMRLLVGDPDAPAPKGIMKVNSLAWLNGPQWVSGWRNKNERTD